MVMLNYVPKKGDFVALNFDPQSGHEQKGRRPALVVSNDIFNQKVGLALACPITNTDRKMPFHLKLPESSVLTGFVMIEQIKSIDFISRHAKFIDKAPAHFLANVLAILDAVIY
jgi:mRNA interferase MazF